MGESDSLPLTGSQVHGQYVNRASDPGSHVPRIRFAQGCSRVSSPKNHQGRLDATTSKGNENGGAGWSRTTDVHRKGSEFYRLVSSPLDIPHHLKRTADTCRSWTSLSLIVSQFRYRVGFAVCPHEMVAGARVGLAWPLRR